MADTKTPLEPGNFYHIYNHAVGNEKLFKSRNNYIFFLEKFQYYLNHFIEVYSYCLMPNHFHFLISVKKHSDILNALEKKNSRLLLNPTLTIPQTISRQFSHFFNSYAQSYNKEYKRKGSLFYNRFKRKAVVGNKYVKDLIRYIHSNPVEAGFFEKVEDWDYSSFNELTNSKNTWLNQKEVMDLFGGMENFIFCHREPYEGSEPS
jgi:REP element-mobilizing transposase RayT